MKQNQYDLIVVGAGISGATIAYIAAHDYHQRVLVIEKETRIGGLAYDETDQRTGLLVQKYGTHFIHTNNDHVYKFLTGIGKFYPFQMTASTVICGKEISIPFHFGAIDSLYDRETASKLKNDITKEFSYEHYVPLMDMLRCDKKNISEFAKLLMREHFIPLAAAQRGVDASKLDGRVMQGNFFQLGYDRGCYTERYQMLPDNGFTSLIQTMLSDPRITLKTGVDAMEHLQIKAGKKQTVDSTDRTGEKEKRVIKRYLYWDQDKLKIPVVYTGAIDELFGHCYGILPYYRVSSSFEYAERNMCARDACTNTPKMQKYYSSTDFSLLQDIYNGKETVIVREYADKNGYPTGPKPKKLLARRYQKYKKLAEETEHLYLCGRLAEYQFTTMADAICRAMETIGMIPFPEIDLTPDYVAYKRPTSEIIHSGDNFKKNAHIPSDLLIGDLNRDLPDVTVIIPTYKRLESLKRALASVWKQDISPNCFDVLVLDNDPTPGNETQRYLSTLKKENLYYYKNRENLGAYGNMNRCIELARTDWVAMLHDDDVLFPNAIRWGLNSKKLINDPKLGIIIPRQMQAFSEQEVQRRMNERGIVQEDLIRERQAQCPGPTRRWAFFQRMDEGTRRRYWKISKFDCYMIPFLYPAPSYGTMINRKAMLDVGGYGEGYPTDDNLCCVKMSEKYNCYLCGESWGVYSFYSADVMKPRSALQFVDAIVQYRLYMEKHSLRCWIAGKIIRQGAYLVAVEGDFWFGKTARGYNTAPENYQYYSEYHATERRKKWCVRIQKAWELWVNIRTVLFGKRIDFDMIKCCNGEHV